jgi:hypothetical protein
LFRIPIAEKIDNRLPIQLFRILFGEMPREIQRRPTLPILSRGINPALNERRYSLQAALINGLEQRRIHDLSRPLNGLPSLKKGIFTFRIHSRFIHGISHYHCPFKTTQKK